MIPLERKIVYLSSPYVSEMVKDALEELESPVPIEIVEVELAEPELIAGKLDRDTHVAVIATPRGHAIFMRELKQTPLVVTDVSGDDFLTAFQRAARLSDEVVVMRYGKVFEELEQFDSLFNLTIHQDSYRTVAEVKKKIKMWMERGVRTFVGTSILYNEAKRAGANVIFLYSKKTIKESLERSIAIVRSMETDKVKFERVNAIIQSSNNAVLATDGGGNIDLINDYAARLIGQPKNEIIGHCITGLLSDISFDKVLSDGFSLENVLTKIHTSHVIANVMPIRVQNKSLGCVVLLQEASKVSDAESKIRKKLTQKGLTAKYHFSDIIHQSTAISKVIEKARIYAKTDATILIQGKTGTGKELFAQSIQNSSNRKHKPFVAINCSALPEHLLESELFGYDDGAFTGAKKGGRQGLFELAHEGTLFLDEVGEITPKLQSRLLRVIQEKELMRVGGNNVIPVDVRIIAATNKDLKQLVDQEEFREDLYYRLNTLFLYIPPLNERKEDLPLLVDHLLAAAHTGEKEKNMIKATILDTLIQFPWNGNIRELENIIQRIVVIFEHTKNIKMIIEVLEEWREKQGYGMNIPAHTHSKKFTLNDEMRNIEHEHIHDVLNEVNGNKELAARRLGISRTTLWRKLNK